MEHIFEKISFQDFEKTQFIDESQIKCENDKCQKSKIETYQNKLYICLLVKRIYVLCVKILTINLIIS